MNWIISANGKMYDHASAFQELGYIDWTQKAKYEVDDIVYIYCTRPYKKIMYKTQVIKINMDFQEITDDKIFWIDKEKYNDSLTGNFTRLKLVEQTDSEELNLTCLCNYGLSAAPQGPVKCSDALSNYIERQFNDYYHENFFTDIGINETEFEGAVHKVLVNRYERSSIARGKCIEFHGIRCGICNINLSDVYGQIAEGFIHVHHVVPISSVKVNYKIDYKDDLIPVCPNCHAMLHRKVNGKQISIDELRNIIDENRP